ncbi:hypothetical protein [Deinococcus cellulosilyticus]|nr:hypothetical protein [Deinococcus cellulosilyticus]
MHHLNTPSHGDEFQSFLPTRHVYGVTSGAAQELCSIADFYYAFGPRDMPFSQSNLAHAARLFEVDLAPQPHLTASQYPFSLEAAILQKAALGQGHTLYVLQRFGGFDSGWRCLIPNHRTPGFLRIMELYRLHLED